MNNFTKPRVIRLTTFGFSLYFIISVLVGKAMGVDTENLFSPILKERIVAYKEIASFKNGKERQQIISALSKILEKEDIDRAFEGPLHLTIKALGELKAEEAVPYMLPYFTFIPEGYRIEEMIPTQWYYPTAKAFVNIGEPVIEYIEKIIIDKDKSDEEKRLAAWTMREILGDELAIEKAQRLEQRHTSCRLSSSEKLSVYLRNFKPTFLHPHKYRN